LAEGTHRTLEHPDRIEELARAAERLGATDLFVQVYRAGRSWFPSPHADDRPYRQIQEAQRLEPLSRMIEAAHARGLRVHAWFNALSLARNREAPLLQKLGREAVLTDRKGRSLLDYPGLDVPAPDRLHTRMGTPQIWLDPSVPGVIEHLEQTVDDLVAAAPDLDGLHLDYIRHPLALPLVPGSRFDVGLDFGYGPEARRGFEQMTGTPFRRGDPWDDFRRETVDDVVRRLCGRLPERWACSAATLPWADRAYLTAMQDFRHWIEQGWLDFAVAMAYTRDDRLLRYLAHQLRGGIEGERIWIGLGAWLFVNDIERARTQIAVARRAAPAGIVLFSYDALADKPGALDALAPEGFAEAGG
jgi:uncharacterized lipoprotein YddW (UPF0748 family)